MTSRRLSWTERDIADQSGRTVVITGANSGLGLRAATLLGEHGARVLLACRSRERGEEAAGKVRGGELVLLDLADLASVRVAAAEIRERTGDKLDLLINNAGITWPPLRRTIEGYESTFATNHLGHAALTWLLMPALRGGTDARVVHVASIAARGGMLDLADPNFHHHRYNGGTAYSQSKQANLIFALELDRRLRAAGDKISSLVAHPGMTDTELFPNSMRHRGRLMLGLSRVLNSLITQSVEAGTLPLLYAALAPEAQGYYGPAGPFEIRGGVGQANVPKSSTAEPVARRLWELTAELTGVTPDPN
jgi:NAD(P)-dependent dehydrogenase (short-subunit alcohol dehydrogenase family)